MSVISIIQKSKLEGALRIDSEYYQPHYIRLAEKLEQTNTIDLGKLSESINRNPMCYGFNYSLKGYPFFRIDDLYSPFVDYSNTVFIDEETHYKFFTTALKHNDIMMGVRGNTVGRLGIYKGDDFKANISPNLIYFRLNEPKQADYVSAILISPIGQLQIKRILAGTGQPTITSDLIKKIKIPVFQRSLEEQISSLINESIINSNLSNELYLRAEKLLLAELGLLEWKPKHTRSFVRRYSEATQARRIDSDFFQPKYDEIISAVKKFQPLKLTAYAKSILKTVKFDAGEFYRYIEIGDINTGTSEVEFTLREAKDLPANAKIEVKGGELLVSKVRPTRGAVGIVPADCAENGVASGAFAVYEVESPMREFLQVFLRSIVGKMQLEKPSKGTSYPVIENADVNSVLIPTLNPSLIKEISDSVKQSHEARREANRLLQLAKRAVETAIEEDEAAGLRVIGAGELSDEGGRMKDEILF